MQRWMVVAFGLSIGACAGSSRDDNGAGEGGGAGADPETGGTSMSGGTSSGGSVASGGSAPSGGTSTGGAVGSGGTVAVGGAVASGGTGPSAGAGTGGTATAGVGNTSSGGSGPGGAGAAGAAGSGSGGCAEPSPAGCTPQAECPPTHRCEVSTVDCRPSQCSCSGGEWVCTRDCAGGTCRPADCPIGCRPEGECGTDSTTWVCTTGPGDWTVFRDAGCQDLATQVPRFCCPATFMPECR